MAKPNITTRSGKGSALSYAELDANFENLQNATISVAADGNTITLDLNDTLTLNAGDNITFDTSGNTITINGEAGGGGDLLTNSILVGERTDDDTVLIKVDKDDVSTPYKNLRLESAPGTLTAIEISDSIALESSQVAIGNNTGNHGIVIGSPFERSFIVGGGTSIVGDDGDLRLESERIEIGNPLNNDNVTITTPDQDKGIIISKNTNSLGDTDRIRFGGFTGLGSGLDIKTHNGEINIEAGGGSRIWMRGPSLNDVMYLICEDTGGISIVQDSFNTSQSPTDTTTPSAWLQVQVGDASSNMQDYYIPLYQ